MELTNPSNDGQTFVWTDRGKKSWTLIGKFSEESIRINGFDVQKDCPHNETHKYAELRYDKGKLIGIYGPQNEFYEFVSNFSK